MSFMSVPVFFATSRQEDAKTGGYAGTRNLSRSDQGVQYGTIAVSVPVEDIAGVDKSAMVKLGWKPVTKKDRKVVKIEKMSRDEFYRALQARYQSTGLQEACVFVHGYNNPFVGAAGSAAQLELALKEPVVLFSWPSAAKTKDYTRDECSAEWSLRPFQVFMQGMEQTFESKHIMTVSHSMGNRLVNWYFQMRYDKTDRNPDTFAEVVLTSPDIDRATFKNYFFKVASNAQRTRIYVSQKDLPLRLSKFVHGSSRAGASSPDEFKWEIPGNIEGTQTVNFTAVDKGILGHSIQYEIIAAMHRSGTPGAGLTVDEDKSYKGEYLQIHKSGGTGSR